MRKLLFLLCLSLTSQPGNAQWAKISGNSYNYLTLFDVYASGSKVIGVGTDLSNFDGAVLITNNDGANWDTLQALPPGWLYKTVSFKSADTGFIGGYGSQSIWLRTIDGGQSWHYQYTDSLNSGINDMHFLDSLHGYATGYGPDQFFSGVCYRTHDGGNTWYYPDSAVAPLDTLPLDYVQFVDPSTGYARPDFLFHKEILKTIDSGKTWNIVYTHAAYTSAIYFWTTDDGIMIDNDGHVHKTSNGGNGWTKTLNDPFNSTPIMGMSFLNNNLGFAIGFYGRIYKTIDGGDTWTQETTPAGLSGIVLRRIRFFDDRAYVIGDNGVILRSGNLVGIGNLSLEDKLSIFPNPVAKQLHIRAACCTLKDAGISIYNMMGQRVYHNIVTGDTVIEVENLAPGSYVVEVKAGQESLRKLISVQ